MRAVAPWACAASEFVASGVEAIRQSSRHCRALSTLAFAHLQHDGVKAFEVGEALG
jgi:hypothetical protein